MNLSIRKFSNYLLKKLFIIKNFNISLLYLKRNNVKNQKLYALFASIGATGIAYIILNKELIHSKSNEILNTTYKYNDTYSNVVDKSKLLLNKIKLEYCCPAISVSVAVDGKEIWRDAIGMADVENGLECSPNHVMRIASISKPLAMAALAKLIENNELNLDLPISHYVSSWPEKTYNGQKATITTRDLVSMKAGIRHYKIDEKNKNEVKELEQSEYFIRKHYNSATDALVLFKDDDLCSMPGTEFKYSTLNWTLVSAVIEGVTGKSINSVMGDLFVQLDLKNTYVEENAEIIPNRARHYVIKDSMLKNVVYVDNSYKIAGGGLLSTCSDLCKFGNILLKCYQSESEKNLFLKPKTVSLLWTPVEKTKGFMHSEGFYGMGWGVFPESEENFESTPAYCHRRKFYISHTGGAIGASSVLLILPKNIKYHSCSIENRDNTNNVICNDRMNNLNNSEEGVEVNCISNVDQPKGIVVAIITNMENVGLNKIAYEIASYFDGVNNSTDNLLIDSIDNNEEILFDNLSKNFANLLSKYFFQIKNS